MNVKILRMRWKMIRSGSFEPRKPVNKSNDEKEIRFQEIEAEEKFFKNEEPNGNQMKWISLEDFHSIASRLVNPRRVSRVDYFDTNFQINSVGGFVPFIFFIHWGLTFSFGVFLGCFFLPVSPHFRATGHVAGISWLTGGPEEFPDAITRRIICMIWIITSLELYRAWELFSDAHVK